MRSRRRTTVWTWPPARSGTGCLPFGPIGPHPEASGLTRLPGGSPCSPPVCRGPGVPRGWLRCLPGVRSNSVASVVLPWAAGRPPACRARRFRCVCDGRDMLARVRRPGRVRRGPTAASLDAAVCAAVQRRKPHRLPSLRRAGYASVASPTDGSRSGRRRPAVLGGFTPLIARSPQASPPNSSVRISTMRSRSRPFGRSHGASESAQTRLAGVPSESHRVRAR
jgi:hypothetical protein